MQVVAAGSERREDVVSEASVTVDKIKFRLLSYALTVTPSIAVASEAFITLPEMDPAASAKEGAKQINRNKKPNPKDFRKTVFGGVIITSNFQWFETLKRLSDSKREYLL
jgi:hypothetical protein